MIQFMILHDAPCKVEIAANHSSLLYTHNCMASHRSYHIFFTLLISMHLTMEIPSLKYVTIAI